MLDASRCPCGRLSVPSRSICPSCRKPMSATKTQGLGKVLTSTTVYVPPEGFTAPLPLVLVELDEKINLLCGGSKALKIGMRVLIQEVEGGYEAISYTPLGRLQGSAKKIFRKLKKRLTRKS